MSSSNLSEPVFILGDMNVAINRETRGSEEYLDLLQSYGMVVTNTFITRPHSNNILDHAISRVEDLNRITNYTISCALSDHNYVLTSLKPNVVIIRKRTLTKSITHYQVVDRQFSEFLTTYNWGNVSPDERLSLVAAKYVELRNTNTTIKTMHVRLKKDGCPWFSYDMKILCHARDTALKKWKRNRTDERLGEILKQANKKLAVAKRKAKKEYYNQFLNARSPKELWKRINGLLGTHNEAHEIVLNIDDRNVSDAARVSNIFNEYFTSIGNQLAEKLSSSNNINLHGTIREVSNSFFLNPATADEVLTIILNLDSSKATGFDGLPISALKHHRAVLSSIIADAFNDSATAGVYPDCLKTAVVYPVFKNGDKKQLSNYRPISVLPAINKVFEQLLARRLLEFLDMNNFFYTKQYGFRKGSSTQTAVLELVDELSDTIDRKNRFAGCLFLDLSKAFDTIDHVFLLKKLESCGIRGLPNTLFSSYLQNRKQTVVINGYRSSERSVVIGVPQGSNLGPLLFLIYVNDLSNLQLNGVPRLFADDSVFSYAGQTPEEIVSMMQEDLNIVSEYLENNLLSLNATKTKFMLFRGPRTIVSTHSRLLIRNIEIEEVDSFKHLGIILDSTLSWKEHIKSVVQSCAPMCGMLRKLSYYLPQHVLLKIYYAFINSRYQYASCVWGSVGKHQLRSLQIQQNRCIKAIYRLPFLHPTINLFNSLGHNIVPISALHEYQTSIIIHRIIHIQDIHHNIELQNVTHQYETRNLDRIVASNFTSEIGRRRFTAIGPRIYNNLPITVRNSGSVVIFKKNLKRYVNNNLDRYL